VSARAQRDAERQHRLDVAAGSVGREQHTHVSLYTLASSDEACRSS
jgi:hypothetical protein